MSSRLWWVHAHYSTHLVKRWTYVSSPLLSHTSTGQEQVPQDEAHGGCCDEFMRGLGRRLPVNFGCSIVVFIWCNYLTILYRTLLYINVVTFISVPWVIICVRLGPSTLSDYVHARGLVPPKPGCDSSIDFRFRQWQLPTEREMCPWAISKVFWWLKCPTHIL
jgi:hypothetical protein